MNYWLLKSEPETFSWDDLCARGGQGETWDGVRNHQAANFLRQMEAGDRGYFYHSGKARSVVGVLEVTQAAFPDPTDASGRFVAVRVRALAALPQAVSLASIKAEPGLERCPLVRQSRLSVMPLTRQEWDQIGQLGGE